MRQIWLRSGTPFARAPAIPHGLCVRGIALRRGPLEPQLNECVKLLRRQGVAAGVRA